MAELAPQDKGGSYVRPSYNFDGRIGDTNFPDEAGRYHLYGGNACPWCHRAVLALNLLEVTKEEVSVTYLEVRSFVRFPSCPRSPPTKGRSRACQSRGMGGLLLLLRSS